MYFEQIEQMAKIHEYTDPFVHWIRSESNYPISHGYILSNPASSAPAEHALQK